MKIVKEKPLPDTDFVIRCVPYKHQFRDFDNDDCLLGISAAAFAPRSKDDNRISVTWIEKFSGQRKGALMLAIEALTKSFFKRGSPNKPLYAKANVQQIKAAGKQFRRSLRVVEDGSLSNKGHAIVKHILADDQCLMEEFATKVFGEIYDIKGKAVKFS